MDAAEREDFDTFVRSRMPQLLGFANALTGDPHRAADLVQDALERTALAWSRVVRRDHPEAYVRRVMVNQHISVWRRLRREHLVADAPETAYEQSATHDAVLWREIGQLPPRQRAVLVLRYYEDLSEAQTAKVLGCSIGTVKSQGARALAQLRVRAASAKESEGSWTS